MALALFGVLAIAQIASSVSVLAAWRYPYKVTGAHRLTTAVHSGSPTETLVFRSVVIVRQDVGVDRLERLTVPSDWNSRVVEFAGNILEQKAIVGSYRWQLPNAEFAATLASSHARQVETGIYLAVPAGAPDYVLFTDARQEHVLIAPMSVRASPTAPTRMRTP